MRIAIWDTYVLREDNKIMHFAILVPEKLKKEKIIFGYGKAYLKTKPFKTKELTADECTFCHYENIKKEEKEKLFNTIKQQEYAIIEFENCS